MALRVIEDHYTPFRHNLYSPIRHHRYCPYLCRKKSFFKPSWDMSVCQENGLLRPLRGDKISNKHYPMLSHGRTADLLEDVENKMESALRSFTQLVPTHPVEEGNDFIQQLATENPYVTDKDGNRKFQLHFDVRQFKPEEIKLKMEGRRLIMHAHHENESDGGHVSRKYQQSHVLPEDLELQKLSALLSPEGVLTVEAPLPETEAAKENSEVHIPVTHK